MKVADFSLRNLEARIMTDERRMFCSQNGLLVEEVQEAIKGNLGSHEPRCTFRYVASVLSVATMSG